MGSVVHNIGKGDLPLTRSADAGHPCGLPLPLKEQFLRLEGILSPEEGAVFNLYLSVDNGEIDGEEALPRMTRPSYPPA
ncbi:hypothetical protein MASR2M17_09680 [Aminivibrio sp.]